MTDTSLPTATDTAVNVDPQELAKFSELAHHWWDAEGEFRALHELNPLRLHWVDGLCGGLQGKTVIDVGCGGGILSESMALKEADSVLGIDLASRSLRVAALHAMEAGLSNVTYRQVAVEALAEQAPASFEVLTCMEMLEHVPDPASIVASCARLLKPGGQAFFSTIHRNPKAFWIALVGAEHVARMVPKGTHEYARFIRPSELAAMARAAGLVLTDTAGLHYNPLTRQFSLTRDTSVNYLLAFHKPV